MAIDESARRERDVRQLARARELMAQGVPYQQASETAAREIIAERRASMPPPQEDPREAAFDASMAEALGQDNLEAAASEIVPEPTVLYRTAPGPVSLATGEAEAGEDLYDPEAVAAYRTRPAAATATDEQMAAARENPLYRGGEYLPSPEDDAMYERGQVYTINPETGARGYSPAYPLNLPGPSGEPGRLGMRPDLERPVIDSKTGLPIPGTQKYVGESADTPFGSQMVYRPSPEFRAQLDGREAMLRRERLVRAAGVSEEDAAKMDLDQLRAAGRSARADDLATRKAEVTRRAMERQNPTALMNDEWRQYTLARRMLGEGAGASPSDVQKAHNEQLTALGLRVAQGQGFQQMTPEQQTLLGLKVGEAERNIPAEERASAYRDKPDVHPSEEQMVDDHVSEMYSTPNSLWGLWGLSSSFTAEEQQQAVDWLVNEKGYKPDKARRIVDGIARKRGSQSWWGNWDGT